MKVLVVSPFGFRPHLRSFTDAVIARALVRHGHTVSAITYAQLGDPDRIVSGGVEVWRARGWGGAYPRLWRVLLGRTWDAIHVFHLRNRMAPLAAELGRATGVPVILSEWGLLHDPYLVEDRDDPLRGRVDPSGPIRSLRMALKRTSARRDTTRDAIANWWYHRALFCADRLLFLSRHNLQLAEQLGIPPDRIKYLPCVVDEELYTPGDGGDKSGTPSILFIGQLKKRKGFDVFLRAIPEIARHYPGAAFTIVSSFLGDRALLERLLTETGCREKVFILEGASNEQKDHLLRMADVILIPSRYEGFGLPVLEAFAARCPVVATDVPAINETIRHGVNGLLVPPGDPRALADAALSVIRSSDLCRRLVENGERELASFHVDRHIGALLDLYRQRPGAVVSGGGSSTVRPNDGATDSRGVARTGGSADGQ